MRSASTGWPRRGLLVAVWLTLALVCAACGPRVDTSSVEGIGNDGPAELGPRPDAATGSDTAGPAGQAATGGSDAAHSTVTDDSPGTDTPGDAAAPATPAAGPPVQIGVPGTMSGLVGDNLIGAVASLRAWAADVNARGGLAGRPVNLNFIDDGGDPGRYVAAVRRLIDEAGVEVMIPMAALTFSAGLPTLEAQGVPAVGGDAAEPGWFQSPIAYPVAGGAKTEGRVTGAYAASALDERKLAIFAISEIAIGRDFANTLSDTWSAAGRDVVVEQSISLAQIDYTAEVLAAKGEGAEIVAISADASGCRRFLESARRQQYKPVFLVGSACFQSGYEAFNDVLANGLYVSSAFEPPISSKPAMQAMHAAVAAYQPNSATRVTEDGVAPRGWLAGKLLEAAVAAGGGVDRESIRAGLHSLRDETLGGLIHPQSWPAGQAHPEGRCARVLQWNGDDFLPVGDGFQCEG